MSAAHHDDNFDGITERHGQRPPTYFMVLFLGLIVWGVIFIAYYLLSGWSSQAEFQERMAIHQQQAAAQTTTPASATAPAGAKLSAAAAGELFAQNCAVCHGATGKGGIGPDLTAHSYKYGRTPDAAIATITAGRSGGMPAFGTQLSKAQIAALADFVLALK